MKPIPLLIATLLMIGCGGPAKLCLVSPWSGTIVTNGTAVKGAKVTLKYRHTGEPVEKVVYTDGKGYFEFEGVWKKVLVQLAHQPVVEQKLLVEYLGTNHTVLEVTKMSYDASGELYSAHLEDPKRKDRLSSQNGKLHFKFDLHLDKTPIGRPE